MDRILKVAKRLKTFTLEDIVMYTGLDMEIVKEFLESSENIKALDDKFEYIETMQFEDKFKMIDKNIPSKNSEITLIDVCEEFLKIKYQTL